MQDIIKKAILDYGVDRGWDANYVQMAASELASIILHAIDDTEEAKYWAREQLKPQEAKQ